MNTTFGVYPMLHKIFVNEKEAIPIIREYLPPDTANYSELVSFIRERQRNINQDMQLTKDGVVANYALSEIRIGERNFTLVYAGKRSVSSVWPHIRISLNGSIVGRVRVN